MNILPSLAITVSLCLFSSSLLAQDGPPKDKASGVVDLAAIMVTGAQPAPGLWVLTRGDKTLLIMGTLSPSPKNITWLSGAVEARIAEADIILGPPGISVGTSVGLLRGAMLLPAYNRSKKNPDGKTLSEILPPADFARWTAMKAIYLGHDNAVEKLRPVHAAKVLFDAAVKRAGMTDESIVDPVVKRVAKREGIRVVSTSLSLSISDPKETLRQLNKTNLDDVTCLQQTMDRLDSDLQTMGVRANAWADGDVAQLRQLPYTDQKKACAGAMASTEIARQQGITNISTNVQTAWLTAAREATTGYSTVFATVPIARLLAHDGIIAQLERDGFQVRSPE